VTAGLIQVSQFIGMSVSFTILTLFAFGFTITLFRNFSEVIAPSANMRSATA
jgi:hypothetical protein